MRNQRREKPAKRGCNHPPGALIPVHEYDAKAGRTNRTGTRCVDCKRFWKK